MMRLNYILPSETIPYASPVKVRENDTYYETWIHRMVKANPDVNFFFTVDSTDIWPAEDPEIDYNTVLMSSGDGTISHTYSPKCPAGCTGQHPNCYWKPNNLVQIPIEE